MKLRLFIFGGAWLALAVPAWGQAEPAMKRGLAFLKNAAPSNRDAGEMALATLALVKTTGTPDDPVVRELVEKVRALVKTDGYRPVRGTGDVYEAAVVLMALTAANADRYLLEIEVIAKFLMERQSSNGSWDYSKGGGGDTSQTQYAILALWEAAAAGIEVPIEVWDKALHWLITRQDVAGGFSYHPTDPRGDNRVSQPGVTHSMSVAGAGSIIICKSQLPFKEKRQPNEKLELLIPVVEETKLEYQPKVKQAQADQAVELSARWMANNITIDQPSGPIYYYLYGLERYASLANLKTVGPVDWYSSGARFLAERQGKEGSWSSNYSSVVDTSFALLFLGRSTQKTITRIQITRLGRGTMVGGRGLPDPSGAVSGLAARRTARYNRALKAPVEDLLSALDDEDDANAESAAVALETVDHQELLRAVKGDKQKLRLLAKNRRPEVRAGALWALARTKDYRTTPVLIDAIKDSDPNVYRAARGALRHLSRRMDAFGMPEDPPPAPERDRWAAEWKKWFDSLRIQIEPQQEFDDPVSSAINTP